MLRAAARAAAVHASQAEDDGESQSDRAERRTAGHGRSAGDRTGDAPRSPRRPWRWLRAACRRRRAGGVVAGGATVPADELRERRERAGDAREHAGRCRSRPLRRARRRRQPARPDRRRASPPASARTASASRARPRRTRSTRTGRAAAARRRARRARLGLARAGPTATTSRQVRALGRPPSLRRHDHVLELVAVAHTPRCAGSSGAASCSRTSLMRGRLPSPAEAVARAGRSRPRRSSAARRASPRAAPARRRSDGRAACVPALPTGSISPRSSSREIAPYSVPGPSVTPANASMSCSSA